MKLKLGILTFTVLILGSCFGHKEREAAVFKENQIVFTDLRGKEIVLDKPATRIFLGFYFESFFAVNGKESVENIVSMSKAEWRDFFNSQWQVYSEVMPQLEIIPDTGSIYSKSFSLEKLFITRPEVMIIAPYQANILGENIQRIEKAGIKVVVIDYNSQTVETHTKSTLILGKIMGNSNRAEQLVKEYKSAVNDVLKRIENVNRKPRVYFELGNKGAGDYGNSYGSVMWGSLVNMAGGDNIALGKIENYSPLNPEYVLSKNPEVIIFAGSYWMGDKGDRIRMGFGINSGETWDRITPYINRAGWNNLDAVKTGRVYSVYHTGSRTIYDYVFLQYIAKSIYPELFKDIDPEKNHKDFYTMYLPVEANGSFMTQYNEE